MVKSTYLNYSTIVDKQFNQEASTMPALLIENLRKTYKSGVHALKDIQFSVEQGDFFALLGPNGAGKSTTIGIITSLVEKTEGRVQIFGHDLSTEPEAAKACIGLVPQEFNFNIFDTVSNIVMNQAGFYGIPHALAKERTDKYLKKVDLWGKRHQIAANLSGGMKRRLMIARALVHEPRLLILDEPTAGVDVEIRRSMWELLQEVNAQGTTVILTTQYLEEAEYLCRNIAIINNGVILENTSMKALLRKLSIETFVLNLSIPINFPPELSGFTCRLMDDTTLEVDIHRDQEINPLFTELTKLSIGVHSLRNKANRLEELFLGIINHHNHGG
jgi:ABC-2 type transport system ATP-binding protein